MVSCQSPVARPPPTSTGPDPPARRACRETAATIPTGLAANPSWIKSPKRCSTTLRIISARQQPEPKNPEHRGSHCSLNLHYSLVKEQRGMGRWPIIPFILTGLSPAPRSRRTRVSQSPSPAADLSEFESSETAMSFAIRHRPMPVTMVGGWRSVRRGEHDSTFHQTHVPRFLTVPSKQVCVRFLPALRAYKSTQLRPRVKGFRRNFHPAINPDRFRIIRYVPCDRGFDFCPLAFHRVDDTSDRGLRRLATIRWLATGSHRHSRPRAEK